VVYQCRVFILLILLLYDALVQARQLLDLNYIILFVDDDSKNNAMPEAAKLAENNK